MSEALPLPMPKGMTKKQLDSLSVFDERWRLLNDFVCVYCREPAYAHPFSNLIWGCNWCGYKTYSVAVYFRERPKCDAGLLRWTTKRVKPSNKLTGSDIPPGIDSDDLATDLARCGDELI
ncbi:MAG: hypothetical protein HYT12_04485 [Candidatus Liptonbacteria bacterium]|nr:hypothetical protein [Candidatus Liptonbacteria bacterium]